MIKRKVDNSAKNIFVQMIKDTVQKDLAELFVIKSNENIDLLTVMNYHKQGLNAI